jgi:uncharacterized protein Yka (UPF0111/DUF47 family)
MQSIRRSFITPFDRSDIKALSSVLDDAIDQMNKTGKVVMLYDVTSFQTNMRAMADRIILLSNIVAEALPLMRNIGANSSRLHQMVGEISRIEEQSDQLNDTGLKELFKATPKDRRAGLCHRGGALRPSGKGLRPVRRRGSRDERHRHRTRLRARRWTRHRSLSCWSS